LTDVIRNWVGPDNSVTVQVWPSFETSVYGPFQPLSFLYTKTSSPIGTFKVSLIFGPFRCLKTSVTCLFACSSAICFIAFVIALPRSVTVRDRVLVVVIHG
jgi:hypothetical protein